MPHAIRYFLRQDYPNKELIIIDDGTDCIEDLVPKDPSIHYYRLEQKQTLGAKLNLACDYASGNIIANWDDDDWYAQRRLEYEVTALENKGTNICGINKLLYFDVNRKTGFQYIYPSDQRVWMLGSSLCYKKELWQRNKFADINVGMDGLFVWATPPKEVKVLEDFSFSVHMIHNDNVSPKKTDSGWWHPYPVTDLKSLMNEDWQIYSNGALYDLENISPEKNASPASVVFSKVKPAITPLRNIFACLVHENEDCIIDLVRNLHYHDPSSIILLYDGSENSDLLSQPCWFEKFGVVIYPHPHPVKHGYLHDFAVKCMQFAIDNFSFDTFTIVDSDQLLIRNNYSGFLSDFFHSEPVVGMLSNAPAKINVDNPSSQVALQAFKEYDLWKPFLQSFADGENKFVYWTFWPSTVFTQKAIADLVKLFDKNVLLKDIMRRTKIWATEEVILPTLVKLLGYEIAATPCSYDFVRFKQSISLRDIDSALRRPDVFWIHPVERKYDNALRKYVRQKFDHYTSKCMNRLAENQLSSGLLLTSSLINRIRKIEGWLSDQEAELLIATVIKACTYHLPPQHIIEIGSYHGKSTVAIGNVIKCLFPLAKVFAIDPHDGIVGASDQGLQKLAPSLHMFKRNIEAEGLLSAVELIRNYSYNVEFNKPVHMIFIDGLHDYPNVARDFTHFSEKIVPGGYVAFHDYANYYPGVVAFVDELLETPDYQKVQLAGSLIVLQKV